MTHNTIAIVGEPLLPIRRKSWILSKHGPPGPKLLELASEELRRSLGPGFPWLKLRPGQGQYLVSRLWLAFPIEMLTKLFAN